MPGYFALFRGVNVGGHNRLPMAGLRDAVRGLGATEVQTLLQSGNLVFHHPEPTPSRMEVQLEELARREFHLHVRCLVRTDDELRVAIAENPFAEMTSEGSRLLVLFLSSQPPPASLARHDPVLLAPEQVVVGHRVIYQWCPEGVLAAPPVAGFVERKLRVVVTARNWNTVTRLAEMLSA